MAPVHIENVGTCAWLDVDCRKVLPDGLIEKVNNISKSRNVVEILIQHTMISDFFFSFFFLSLESVISFDSTSLG